MILTKKKGWQQLRCVRCCQPSIDDCSSVRALRFDCSSVRALRFARSSECYRAVAHAARGAEGSQGCREDADDDLNDGLPRFLVLHGVFSF